MHLVLGPERIDLQACVLVVARSGAEGGGAAGAEVHWADVHRVDGPEPAAGGGARAGAGSTRAPRRYGTDARTADDVHRLADAGAVAVGLADPSPASCGAAVERGLAVVVPAAQAHRAGGLVADDRLLVLVDGRPPSGLPGVPCLDLVGEGPDAWGRATVALTAGVRVVRTVEPRSLRRIATVTERIRSAAPVAGATP